MQTVTDAIRNYNMDDASRRLEAERTADRLAETLAELLKAIEPPIRWLAYIRDKGEQVGNLDMGLVDKALTAIAKAQANT